MDGGYGCVHKRTRNEPLEGTAGSLESPLQHIIIICGDDRSARKKRQVRHGSLKNLRLFNFPVKRVANAPRQHVGSLPVDNRRGTFVVPHSEQLVYLGFKREAAGETAQQFAPLGKSGRHALQLDGSRYARAHEWNYTERRAQLTLEVRQSITVL